MFNPEPSLRDLFFRNGHLLVLSVLVIVLAGLSALTNLPRIEDPRLVTRNAIIITTFPGASAERVEALVTKKLEDRLREVELIKDIQSTSRANISVITIELQDSVDASNNQAVFSRVRDKLADAETQLPPGAGKPEFDDERGASAFALVVALNSSGGEPLGLLTRLADELADRMRNLAGVERVRLYGDTQEEITVTLNRGELAAQGLTSAAVAQLIAAADPKSAAGALRGESRDLFLEVAGELDSVARIRNLVLRQGAQGRLLRLGDVATVERGWTDPPTSVGYLNGVRSVFVAVSAAPGVRIDQWQLEADKVLAQFVTGLDPSVHVEEVFRQSDYTSERLSGLTSNLLLGACVVVLVVLFGMGLRAALIVGTALPLSSLSALFGLTFFGQQIHQMTIFGMIIAIGLLIDNAIVVTDEIQNRLRSGMERRAAVNAAVAHLFAPLLASTVTTILGFMPIFLLPGNIGDFVGPIAISVVLALSSSFVISLTIIAALAGRFVPRPDDRPEHRRWWHNGVQTPRLEAASGRLLTEAFNRPLLAVGASLVLPVAGFLLAGTIGLQFFPPAERDQFEITVRLPQESSLQRSRDVAQSIESVTRGYAGVEQISWLVGGSHPQLYYNRVMKEDQNAAYAHAVVQTDTTDRAAQMVRELGPDLEARFPEAQVIVAPFAQGPPVDAPVGFRIVGPSLRVLAEKGAELRQAMHRMPEVTHSRASIASRAKLTFAADQTRVELAGMSLSSVAQQLQGNLEGYTGGSVREDLEELPVRIRYDNSVRGSLADIASMPLLPAGAERWVPADALGSMQVEPEAASITRRNGERVNIVHGWVIPGALPIEVSNRVLAQLDAAGFSLPPGYRLELEGDSDAQRDAVAKLTTYLPVLLMLMLATLVMSFRSVVSAGIVALVAVLSAGLGMLSLWLSGFKLGFNPLLGSAGLVGVAINGAIVVLAGLRADPEAKNGNIDAIVRVVQREARHVLATTATTMGGFVPLLVFSGGEFWPPLAVVMAGGVGLSVILSLVLTPALVTIVVRRRARRRAASALPQAAGVLLLLLLSGCAVGPNYEAPARTLSDEWIGAESTTADEPLNDWWRSFDDPLIEQYVETALDSNRDLRVAGARLREARALREQARSLFLPNVNASLGYNRFTLSQDSPFLAGSGVQGAVTSSLYDAGFDAAWELDVFGGVRRRNEAAVAVTEATESFVDAVRLSIIAEVVRSFAELRGFQRRLEVAERNLRLQDETLTLVEGRVASGLAPELDALNARAQLYATRSTLPQLEAAIQSSVFRLATLTARTPEELLAELSAARSLPVSSAALNPGLRGEILRRRPDIAQAERQLAAASAEIGVAVSEMFPKFVLSGNFGWQAQAFNRLAENATQNAAIVPGVSVPLFTGGRLRAQVEGARARHEAALASYEQAVLLAIEESEGALVRYGRTLDSRDQLAEAASASAEAADVAGKLYDSGLADFLNVLDADRRRLLAEDELVVRQTETLINLVAVYKALGAG